MQGMRTCGIGIYDVMAQQWENLEESPNPPYDSDGASNISKKHGDFFVGMKTNHSADGIHHLPPSGGTN
jgi:hypothetical protein